MISHNSQRKDLPTDLAIALLLLCSFVFFLGASHTSISEWVFVLSPLVPKWPWMAIFLTALLINGFLVRLFFRRVIEFRRQGTKLRSILEEEQARFSIGFVRTFLLAGFSALTGWMLFSSFMGDFFKPNTLGFSYETQFYTGLTFSIVSTMPLSGLFYLAFVRVSKYEKVGKSTGKKLPARVVLMNEIIIGSENEDVYE